MVIVFNKLFIVSLATKKVAIGGLNIFEKKKLFAVTVLTKPFVSISSGPQVNSNLTYHITTDSWEQS